MDLVSLTVIIKYFVLKNLKQLFSYFVYVNLLRFFGKMFLIGFRLNFATILLEKSA